MPILQSELINRGESAEALKVSEHLVNQKKRDEFLKSFDTKKFISEQLENGESLEGIKMRLEDMGVDISKAVTSELEYEDSVLNYITRKKEEGLDNESLSKDLKENFGIDPSTTKLLDSRLRRMGNRNLVIGTSLVVISSAFVLIALEAEVRIGLGALFALGIGIWKINEGSKQRRKLKGSIQQNPIDDKLNEQNES